MGVELAIHMAPRILREGRDFSQPIQPGRSVLAGTRGANDLARCMIYEVLEETHAKRGPCLQVSSWVDDVNMRARGFLAKVKQAIMDTGTMFAIGVWRQRLELSTKSVCFASVKGLAQQICSDFGALGIPIRPVASGPDLGIDRGRRRAHSGKAGKRAKAVAARFWAH